MFIENKHTTVPHILQYIRMHSPRKVKRLVCNTNCSHLHKIFVALQHHKFTQYSRPGLALCHAWMNDAMAEHSFNGGWGCVLSACR